MADPSNPAKDTTLSKQTNALRQVLSLPFKVPGRNEALVEVVVEPCHNPQQYGLTLLFPSQPKSQLSALPICNAKIKSSVSRGYASMYGWVQIYRDDKTQQRWEMDPIPITQSLDTPFCWFGPEQQLFDAPARIGVSNLDWAARSFLTYIDDCLISQVVRPILAFEWGFDIHNGEVSMKALKTLELDAWDEQVPFFKKQFPSWQFVEHAELGSNASGE